MDRSIAKNTADLARGAGSSYLGFLARLMLRAPFLFLAGWLYGSTKFGLYTLAVTIAETLAVLATFGLKNSIYKFLDETDGHDRDRGLHPTLAHVFAITLTLSVVLALLLALTGVVFITLNLFIEWADALVVISPVIFFIVLADIALVAIRHRRIVRYEILSRSVIEPIVMTTGVALTYFLGWRSYGLILAYLFSLIAASMAAVIFFSRLYDLSRCLKAPLSWHRLSYIVRFTAPTALFQLLRFVAARVDILMVSWFFSPAIVGIYGMAWQFSTVFKKIRSGFDTLLGPVISQEVTRNNFGRVNDHLATVARWVLSIQMPLILVVVFFGGQLLGLVGVEFQQGATILLLLVLTDVINGSLSVHEWPLVFLKPILNPLLLGMMMIVNVILGILAIHWFGPAGVAAAGVVTYLMMNGVRVGLNVRFFKLLGLRWDILKPLLASLITALFLSLMQFLFRMGSWHRIGLMIMLMLIIYFLTLVLLGVNSEDRLIIAHIRNRLQK